VRIEKKCDFEKKKKKKIELVSKWVKINRIEVGFNNN